MPEGVGGFEHLIEVVHGAELGHNSPVVADVVAHIIVGGGEDGGEPDDVDAEVCQVG